MNIRFHLHQAHNDLTHISSINKHKHFNFKVSNFETILIMAIKKHGKQTIL